MKFAIGLFSLALVVVLSQGAPSLGDFLVFDAECEHMGKQHNFTYGQRSYGDKILYEDNVNFKSKFWQKLSVDVTYPRSGDYALGTISYIEIIDKRSDGTGGCAFLRNGGPGQRTVTLHLKSQRNHGMGFTIRVYGR